MSRAPIDTDTRVIRAARGPVEIAALSPDAIRLRWSGGTLDFPVSAADPLHAVAGLDATGMAVGNIPGLGHTGRCVLIRRLLDEGFLSLDEHGRSAPPYDR
jgi:hypothetical protein